MPDLNLFFMPSMFFISRRIMTNLENRAIGITPGVELHASFMCFLNHEFQWIIKWNGRFPLFARQPLTPGFDIWRIKSITGRPYLNNHCIHSIALMHVELPDEFCFLFFGAVIAICGPINIIHGGYPYRPEFIFGL